MKEYPKQVYEYTIYIKGIFGRNRSVKFQGFPLFKGMNDLDTMMEVDQAKQLFESRLPFLGFKKGYAKLVCQSCTLSVLDGIVFKETFIGLNQSGRVIVPGCEVTK